MSSFREDGQASILQKTFRIISIHRKGKCQKKKKKHLVKSSLKRLKILELGYILTKDFKIIQV